MSINSIPEKPAKVGKPSRLSEILERYEDVFGDDLGCCKGPSVSILVQQDAAPRFRAAWKVPYAWNQKLEGELEQLQEEGIIEPVRHSDWASPIVPILKSDGSLRICRDYKRTVNSVCKVDVYPLPRVEDLFAKLERGKKFTKIDLRQAYAQLPLDEGSRQLTTINTQHGLFQYRRLPFGIASTPAIFQRRIEGILLGVTST